MVVPYKIADNEMKYFQFKARQMFLLQKEDHEWQEFCKKNASNCSACLVEKYESKTSKDVEIQTSTKKANGAAGRTPIQHSSIQSRQTPENIKFIKTKLEKIDLTLTEMLKVPMENITRKQESKPIDNSTVVHDSLLNTLNDSRRQLIQKSLKESLQRLQASSLQKPKSIPSSKFRMKNSGYFLPHDLQKQRVIARKAYLASLPKNAVAPKVTSSVTKGDKRKPVTIQQDKKQAVPKLKKKVNTKLKKKLQEEPTLISTDPQLEMKDENLENAVDGILDDLIGETVLVVNKIKLMKDKKQSSSISPAANPVEVKQNNDKSAPPSLKNETASPQKENTLPKSIYDDYRERESLCKQKYTDKKLPDISENVNNELKQYRNFNVIHDQEKTVLNDTASISHFPHVGIIRRTLQLAQCKKRHELSIDSETARHIKTCRKEFWKYLRKISLTEKGNFNPWTLANTVAEAILDDCLLDISKELGDLPSSLVTKLYTDEFTQLY